MAGPCQGVLFTLSEGIEESEAYILSKQFQSRIVPLQQRLSDGRMEPGAFGKAARSASGKNMIFLIAVASSPPFPRRFISSAVDVKMW